MFKTFTINLAGQIFHINEDAFEILSNYLKSLKNIYQKEEGGDEIMADIEARISEIILADNKNDAKKIIEKDQVLNLIHMLGSPEQHTEESNETEQKSYGSQEKTTRRMFRDPSQQKIAGVCSGLSQYLGINDPIWLRLLFIVSVIAGFGSGILIYIVLWILLPEATTASEKLQMKGEAINLENIEKTIKDGINNVSNSLNDIDGKGTIQRTTKGLGDILIGIFKGLLKVVKAFLLIILVIVTFSFVISFFSMGIGTIAIAPALSEFIFESKALAYLTAISFVVLMLLTSLFLILLPFQLFSSNKKPLKKPVGITIGILWLGTFLLTIIGTTDAFRHYSNQKKTQNEEIISGATFNDTIYIASQSHEGSLVESSVGIHWDDWKIVNGGLQNGRVTVNIAQSPDQDIHIFEELYSRGSNLASATKNVKNISYEYRKSGDTLVFNDYIQNKLENTKFRFQSVELTVYIPNGKTLVFDNVDNILGKLPRIKNMEEDIEYGMENNLWKLDNGFLVPLSGVTTQNIATRGWTDVTPSNSFSDVEISGFIDTEIIYSNETKVLVNLPGAIDVSTSGKTLELDMKNGSFKLHPGRQAYKVKIFTPDLTNVTASGLTNTVISGFLQDKLSAEVEGSSTITLNNNTIKNLSAQIEGISVIKGSSDIDNANLIIEGMSRYEGDKINHKNVQVKIEGNSEASVNASESVKGKLNGTSRLYYTGTPSLEVTTNGTAEVLNR